MKKLLPASLLCLASAAALADGSPTYLQTDTLSSDGTVTKETSHAVTLLSGDNAYGSDNARKMGVTELRAETVTTGRGGLADAMFRDDFSARAGATRWNGAYELKVGIVGTVQRITPAQDLIPVATEHLASAEFAKGVQMIKPSSNCSNLIGSKYDTTIFRPADTLYATTLVNPTNAYTSPGLQITSDGFLSAGNVEPFAQCEIPDPIATVTATVTFDPKSGNVKPLTYTFDNAELAKLEAGLYPEEDAFDAILAKSFSAANRGDNRSDPIARAATKDTLNLLGEFKRVADAARMAVAQARTGCYQRLARDLQTCLASCNAPAPQPDIAPSFLGERANVNYLSSAPLSIPTGQ